MFDSKKPFKNLQINETKPIHFTNNKKKLEHHLKRLQTIFDSYKYEHLQ